MRLFIKERGINTKGTGIIFFRKCFTSIPHNWHVGAIIGTLVQLCLRLIQHCNDKTVFVGFRGLIQDLKYVAR